jgi:signal transduction histidine kinase
MEKATNFAPPERSSAENINSDNSFLVEERTLLDMLGAISGITAILDDNRQIVYANKDLLYLLGIESLDAILGKRPGEAVGCIHAGEMAYGCGTSEACSVCGAVNAIMESQTTGLKSVKETRITTRSGEQLISLDLSVTSAPVKIRNRVFYVFTIQDISNEKRRQNLEKIFFHDILNSAGSLNGLLTILKEGADPEETREIIDMSEETSRYLIEEIMLHRQIRAAESGDLTINPEMIDTGELLRSAVGKISHHEVANTKKVQMVDHCNGTDIFTDRILLQRVLLNLLKNALEATENEGTIYAEVEKIPGGIRFKVKNDAVMPKEIQLQMFQRSFSTRGKGRGIGTYSIKLLTENYLKGKVGFTSAEPEGTVFFIELFNPEISNTGKS